MSLEKLPSSEPTTESNSDLEPEPRIFNRANREVWETYPSQDVGRSLVKRFGISPKGVRGTSPKIKVKVRLFVCPPKFVAESVVAMRLIKVGAMNLSMQLKRIAVILKYI